MFVKANAKFGGASVYKCLTLNDYIFIELDEALAHSGGWGRFGYAPHSQFVHPANRSKINIAV
jgi:hypothetical protein